MAVPLKSSGNRPSPDEQQRSIRAYLMMEAIELSMALNGRCGDDIYPALVTAMKDLMDIIFKLDGLPKGIHDIAPTLNDILAALDTLGWNRIEFFNAILDELRIDLAKKDGNGSERLSNTPEPPLQPTGDHPLVGADGPPPATSAGAASPAASDAP